MATGFTTPGATASASTLALLTTTPIWRRAAFVLWEATNDPRYLERCQVWGHVLNDHFWDGQNGGYFYTSDDSDPLIVRSRMVLDQATPSANGIMVSLLGRLQLVTAEKIYRDRCNALIDAFSGEAPRAYMSMASFFAGLELVITGLQIVVIGPLTSPKTHELVAAVVGRSLPSRTLLVVDP